MSATEPSSLPPAAANRSLRRRAEGALAHTKLITMAVVGVAVAIVASFGIGWVYAVVIGWAAACVVFISWVWFTISPMDAHKTRSHATREDPSRRVSDSLILLASVASLVIVVYVLVNSKNASGPAGTGLLAAVAVGSAALSWTLVHTLFMLRYASIYYRLEKKEKDAGQEGPHGGISFNQDDDPRYTDFAYFSFTLGMTFQVSDTNISSHRIRATVLRHALLSYLFGSVILGTIVNLIGGLAG